MAATSTLRRVSTSRGWGGEYQPGPRLRIECQTSVGIRPLLREFGIVEETLGSIFLVPPQYG